MHTIGKIAERAQFINGKPSDNTMGFIGEKQIARIDLRSSKGYNRNHIKS